jgi:hypothetical protein
MCYILPYEFDERVNTYGSGTGAAAGVVSGRGLVPG